MNGKKYDKIQSFDQESAWSGVSPPRDEWNQQLSLFIYVFHLLFLPTLLVKTFLQFIFNVVQVLVGQA